MCAIVINAQQFTQTDPARKSERTHRIQNSAPFKNDSSAQTGHFSAERLQQSKHSSFPIFAVREPDAAENVQRSYFQIINYIKRKSKDV
jgi:hypothetical protein